MGSIPVVLLYMEVTKMDLEQLFKQAIRDGMITCENCGNSIEPDAERCYCGWINPIRI